MTHLEHRKQLEQTLAYSKYLCDENETYINAINANTEDVINSLALMHKYINKLQKTHTALIKNQAKLRHNPALSRTAF